jgi:hypothetical protein
MNKWEYCQLHTDTFEKLGHGKSTLRFFQPDGQGKEIKDESGVLIALVGLEGWELVSTSHIVLSPYAIKTLYTFKKPIQEKN